jgi:hypothetical protein
VAVDAGSALPPAKCEAGKVTDPGGVDGAGRRNGAPARPDRFGLVDVEPHRGIWQEPARLTAGYAAARGAGRGAVAGLVYAVVLAVAFAILDLVNNPLSLREMGSSGQLALVVTLVAVLAAVPVGTVLGCLAGLFLLLLARSSRPEARGSLAGPAVGLVTCVGLTAVITVGIDRWQGVDLVAVWLGFALLPGVVGGVAARRHMRMLCRLATQLPPGPA